MARSDHAWQLHTAIRACASRTNHPRAYSRRCCHRQHRRAGAERSRRNRIDVGVLGSLDPTRGSPRGTGAARGQRQSRQPVVGPLTISVDSRRAYSRSPRPNVAQDTADDDGHAGSHVHLDVGQDLRERDVLPSRLQLQIRSRNRLRPPRGSRPVIGSSRMTSSESDIKACAMPIAAACPSELASGRPALIEPTRAISCLRARAVPAGNAHSAPMSSRTPRACR